MSLFLKKMRAEKTLNDFLAIMDRPDDETVLTAAEGTAVPVDRRTSRIVPAVVRELRAGGMSAMDILATLKLILDLIQIVGPIVQEIVRRIRERHAATVTT